MIIPEMKYEKVYTISGFFQKYVPLNFLIEDIF